MLRWQAAARGPAVPKQEKALMLRWQAAAPPSWAAEQELLPQSAALRGQVRWKSFPPAE